jgi:hypothetical protein
MINDKEETMPDIESNQMKGYTEAYAQACGQLKDADPQRTAQSSGCTYDEGSHSILLPYLNRDYIIECASGEVQPVGEGKPIPLTVKVLMLHYLLHARQRPLSGKLISFREVQGGGAQYYPAFEKRAIFPLMKAFEQRPELLIEAGLRLGGTLERYGDASVTIPIFPLLPVTYVIYQGDAEIPGSAAILFDETVNGLLPCEDIVLVASYGTYELIKTMGT